MEVKLLGPDSEERVVVYVSYSCTSEYGLPQNELPEFPSEINGQKPALKHNNTDRIPPKCFGWEDVFLTEDGYSVLGSGFDQAIERYSMS